MAKMRRRNTLISEGRPDIAATTPSEASANAVQSTAWASSRVTKAESSGPVSTDCSDRAPAAVEPNETETSATQVERHGFIEKIAATARVRLLAEPHPLESPPGILEQRAHGEIGDRPRTGSCL